MKKILAVGGIVIVLISGLLFYKLSRPSISKQIADIKDDMTGYHLEATMKMLDGEDLRTFLVKVDFQKKDETDLFCVDLEDQASKQKQRIIRNQQGVFVVAPSLNRAFQFKSEWPYNSFKPYIMQTMMEIFEGEYESENIDDGYQISSALSYPSDPRVTHLEIVFDDEIKLKNVTLYDDNESEIVQLDVNTFTWNPSFDASIFEIKEVKSTEGHVSLAEDLPFYPLEKLGNELIDQSKAEINGTEKHILRFSGDKHFTIVEDVIDVSEEFMIEKMNGEILEVNGGLAFIDEKVVTYFEGDVMCQVYSDLLSKEEKLQVISSMQNSVVIEP